MRDEDRSRDELLAEVRDLRRRLSLGLPDAEACQACERAMRALLEASTETIFLMDPEGRVTTANRTAAERLATDLGAFLGSNVFSLLPPEVVDSRRRILAQVLATAQPATFEDERLGRTIQSSLFPVVGPDGTVTHVAVFGRDVTDERRSLRLLEASTQRLAEANRMLQRVVDTIPVRIYWKDADLVYLGCNRLFARDVGRDSPEDLVGTRDEDLLSDGPALARAEEDRRVLRTGEPVLDRELFIDGSGEGPRWLRTTKIPLRGPDGSPVGILGTYEVITHRKLLEARLRESEERYRSVFQNNHAVLLILDPEDGSILDANPAACHYYGYALERLRCMKITDINVLTLAEVHEEMARARAEERHHFLFTHRLADGTLRPVEVYSGPVTLAGRAALYSIVHDIGERRKAEEDRERLIRELQEALSQVRTLSGLLPICAMCKKIRDDQGYWQQIESFIHAHSQAEFTHGLCPDCARNLRAEAQQL